MPEQNNKSTGMTNQFKKPYPEEIEIYKEHATKPGVMPTAQEASSSIFSKMRDTEKELEGIKGNLSGLGAQEVGFYLKKVKEAQDAYKEASEGIKTRELVETLIQAGTQIAASLYGLKHNLAIGKLDFKKTNFGRQYDEALSTLRQAKDVGKIEARAEVAGTEGELKAREETLADRLRKLKGQQKTLTEKEEERRRMESQQEMFGVRQEAAETKTVAAEEKQARQNQVAFAQTKRREAKSALDKLAAKDRKFEDIEQLASTTLGISFNDWNNAEVSTLAKLTNLPEDKIKNYIDQTNIGSDENEYKDKMEKLLGIVLKEQIQEQEGILSKLGASYEGGAEVPQSPKAPAKYQVGDIVVRKGRKFKLIQPDWTKQESWEEVK